MGLWDSIALHRLFLGRPRKDTTSSRGTTTRQPHGWSRSDNRARRQSGQATCGQLGSEEGGGVDIG
jgi:hypothetical protein